MKRSFLFLLLLVACKAAPAVSAEVDAAASAVPAASVVASSTADAGRKLTLADLGGGEPHLGVASDDPNEALVAPTPTGPRGLAATKISSAQPPISDADRVVANTRPKFRMCYQKDLDANPKLAGDVEVEATVKANGEVETASAKPGSPALATVAECVVHVTKGLAFTAPPGPSKLTFKVSFEIDTKKR